MTNFLMYVGNKIALPVGLYILTHTTLEYIKSLKIRDRIIVSLTNYCVRIKVSDIFRPKPNESTDDLLSKLKNSAKLRKIITGKRMPLRVAIVLRFIY